MCHGPGCGDLLYLERDGIRLVDSHPDGKDRATIANALRILKLSDFILSQLKKGQLSRGHAKALLSIEDVSDREKLAHEILEKSLSVRQAEKTAQDKKLGKEPASAPASQATGSEGVMPRQHMPGHARIGMRSYR